jgi:hypothetical protein
MHSTGNDVVIQFGTFRDCGRIVGEEFCFYQSPAFGLSRSCKFGDICG